MSKLDIKHAKWELRKLSDLTNWENNPRSILKEEFERLKENITTLGVHNGLLVNQDNIVLGGNMRLRAFQELNKTYNLDEVMCRVVETADEGQMLQYALNDNDAFGQTDELKLAEVFSLHPIDMRLHKIVGNVLKPLDHIINPPDPVVEAGEGVDQSDHDESLESYLNGSIKQIVLYYDNETYQQMVGLLEAAGKELGLQNNTEIITHIVRVWHEGNSAKKAAS